MNDIDTETDPEHDVGISPLTMTSGALNSSFDSVRLNQLLKKHTDSKYRSKSEWVSSKRRQSLSSLSSDENVSVSMQARTSLAILAKAYDSKPLSLSVKHRKSYSLNFTPISKQDLRSSPTRSLNETVSDRTTLSTSSDGGNVNRRIEGNVINSGTISIDSSNLREDCDNQSVNSVPVPIHSDGSVQNQYLYLMSSFDKRLSDQDNHITLSDTTSVNHASKPKIATSTYKRYGGHNVDTSESHSISIESFNSENAYLHQLAHITGNNFTNNADEERSPLECYLSELDKLAVGEQSLSESMRNQDDPEPVTLDGPRFSTLLLTIIIFFCILMLTLQDISHIHSQGLGVRIPLFIIKEIDTRVKKFDEYIKILRQYEKDLAARVLTATTFYSPISENVTVIDGDFKQRESAPVQEYEREIFEESNSDRGLCVDDFLYWIRVNEEQILIIPNDTPTSLKLSYVEKVIESPDDKTKQTRSGQNSGGNGDVVVQRHRERIRAFWTTRSSIALETNLKNSRIDDELNKIGDENMDDFMRKKSDQFWTLLEEVVQDEQEDRPLMDFATELFKLFTRKKKRV